MLRNVMTVGFWTLMSRVLGMLREVMLYALIGAGPVLDAFIAAFRLPNMFRRFTAEGAFNAAFVPMFSKRIEADDNPIGFANQAMGSLSFVLLILTALAMIFMPTFIWATANGFVADPRFDLSVDYARVMFPYILFISLAALISGTLNSIGKFAVAAAAPVLLNIIIIFALCIAWISGGSAIQFLIWSVPVAGVLQLGLVWYHARTCGLSLRLTRPRFSPEMKQLLIVATPAALANGVVQINLLVGQLVSSQQVGAISWLYGADRLYQLPLGVVGIAVGIVLLPELSKHLKSGNTVSAKAALSNGAFFASALSLPATLALIVIPFPLAAALYGYGQNTIADVEAIAIATAIYALGLPAFMLQKLQQPLFFAREDTKTPFQWAVVSMIINALIAIGLWPWLGWLSPAIATVVSSWAMVGLLNYSSRAFGEVARIHPQTKSKILRAALASLGMGLVLWAVQYGFGAQFANNALQFVWAILLVGLGAIAYVLFARLFGAFRLGELRSALRK